MSTSTRTHSDWTLALGSAVLLTALLALLLGAFAWPASTLEPRGLPLVVAGSPESTAQVQAQLAAAEPGAFDLTTVSTRAAAVEAIEDREAYGGIIVASTGPEVLTASAASPAVAQLLQGLAGQLAEAAPAGVPAPAVTDVVPAPEDDPRGTAFASGALPLVLGGIATAAVLSLRVRSRVPSVVGAFGVALGAGLALAAILQFWLGALDGSYLANATIVALGITAIALSVLGLRNLLGPAGLGLGAATILLLGNPLSGVTSAPELLPDGWSTVGAWMPPGALASGLRSTAFFDGAGIGGPLVVLGAWIAVGLTLALLPSPHRGRASAASDVARGDSAMAAV